MKNIFKFSFLLLICLSFFACKDNLKEDEMRDKAGNVYKKVSIGNQEWMASNLRAKYTNQSNSLSPDGSTSYADATYPDGNSANLDKYGMLYTFNGAKALLPGGGWRIPTEADVVMLCDALEITTPGKGGNLIKTTLKIDGFPGLGTGIGFNNYIDLWINEESSSVDFDYHCVELYSRDFPANGITKDDVGYFNASKNTRMSVRFVRDIQ